MAAPVKHLFLVPVKTEMHQANNVLKVEHRNAVARVFLIKQRPPNVKNNFKLALPSGNGTHFFEPKEIIRLEAKNNCTKFFFTNNRCMLICKTLKEYQSILAKHGFIRIHKSHLINKIFIVSCFKRETALMQDNAVITIARRKRKEVMALLKNQEV